MPYKNLEDKRAYEKVYYEKIVSLGSIKLEERNMVNEIVGKYILDEGCLYKIELVEKFTLIYEKK